MPNLPQNQSNPLGKHLLNYNLSTKEVRSKQNSQLNYFSTKLRSQNPPSKHFLTLRSPNQQAYTLTEYLLQEQ